MSLSPILRNLRSLNVICTRNLWRIKRFDVSLKVDKARTVIPNIRCVTPLLLKRNMALADVKNIGFGELKNHQNRGTLIIDVRELEEIAETGVLPGGINIPLGDLSKALDKTPEDFMAAYGCDKPGKDCDIVFSCRSGKRSAQACNKALELGFTRVLNFQGGWLEWEKQTTK